MSRQTSETGQAAVVYQQFDLAGRRTQLSTSSGYLLNFTRLVTGEMTAIVDGSSNTWASMNYDNLGRRTSMSYNNGATTYYDYDAVSRLSNMTHDLPGTSSDLDVGLAYNPASQVISHYKSNDAYAWTGHGSGSTATVTDGLNRIATSGGATAYHDGNGNLSGIGAPRYSFDHENRLIWDGAASTTLFYDPLGRLWQLSGGGSTTIFAYDGVEASPCGNMMGPARSCIATSMGRAWTRC